jgi:hypothetical protein
MNNMNVPTQYKNRIRIYPNLNKILPTRELFCRRRATNTDAMASSHVQAACFSSQVSLWLTATVRADRQERPHGPRHRTPSATSLLGQSRFREPIRCRRHSRPADSACGMTVPRHFAKLWGKETGGCPARLAPRSIQTYGVLRATGRCVGADDSIDGDGLARWRACAVSFAVHWPRRAATIGVDNAATGRRSATRCGDRPRSGDKSERRSGVVTVRW